MRAEIRKVSGSNNPKEILPNWTDLEYLDDSTDVGTVVFTYPKELKGYELIEDGGEYALFVDGQELPNGRFILDETDGNEVDDTGPKYKWSGQTTLSVFEEAIVLPKKDNQAKQDMITKSEQKRYEEAAKEWMADERKDLKKSLKDSEKEIRDDAKEHYKGEKPDHLNTQAQINKAVTEAKQKEKREWKKQHDTDEDGSVDWHDFDPSGKLGRDLEGAPPPEKPAFNNATPGEVLSWAIKEAKQRGCFPKVHLGFTDKRDSNGKKWEERITTKIEVGSTVLDLIRWMTERGKAEARMHGWRIDLYNRESGVDRANPRVLIARGYNITDAPRQASSRDRVSSVYVMSQNGIHGYIRDHDLVQQIGVKEAAFTVEDVEKWAEADTQGRAYLDRQGRTREQHIYGVAPNTGADPYKNFDIADWIYVMLRTSAEKQRVRQIVLTWSNDKSDGEIKLTLNDVITERRIAHERMLKNQGGRSTLTKRAGAGPHHSRRQPDGISPKKPSTPKVESRNGIVRIAYDGKDVDGNDPVFDEDHIEVHAGADPDFVPDTVYGTTLVSNFNSPGVAVLTNEDYGSETFFKLVSVDEGGDRSEPSDAASAVVQQVTPADVTWDPEAAPPVVPVAPTAIPGQPQVTGMKAAMAVRFDGIVNETAVEYQIHMSTNPLFDPTFDDPNTKLQDTAGNFIVANRLPPMTAPTNLEYDNPDGTPKHYYFRVFAFNEAGHSAASAVGDGTMDRTSIGDLVADAVITQLLESLNVRAQDLVIGSDTGRRLVLNVLSGFTIYSQAGQPLVAMPTDENDEISITAKAVLSTLEVTAGMTLFGPNHKIAGGATVTLKTGVSDPIAAPTVVLNLNEVTLDRPSGGELYGLAYSASTSRYYSAFIDDAENNPRMEVFSTAGAELFSFALSPSFLPKGGCAYDTVNGRLCFLVESQLDGKWYWEVRNLDGTLKMRNTNDMTFGGHLDGVLPAAGWDYVNDRLMRVGWDSMQGAMHAYADSCDANGVSTLNLANWWLPADSSINARDNGCIARVTGATVGAASGNRIIWRQKINDSAAPFRTYDDANPVLMTRDLNGEWVPSGGWTIGLVWNTTLSKFATSTADSAILSIFESGGNAYYGASIVSWKAATTFYDSDATGGTHETKPSPLKAFTMKKRWRAQITTAPPPDYGGTDDPDFVRVYIYDHVAPGTSHLQGVTVTGALTVLNYTNAGAAAPSSNNFPATAPAKFLGDANTNGKVVDIRGDGFARVDMAAPIGGGVPMFHLVTAGSEPPGWLVGDGREVSGSSYPVLASLWGTGATSLHGAAATGNIKLPDTIDRVLVGAGTGTGSSKGVGGTEGAAQGSARYNRWDHDHTHPIPSVADHDHGPGTLSAADHATLSWTGAVNTGIGGTAQRVSQIEGSNAGSRTFSHNINGGRTGAAGGHNHGGADSNASLAHPRIGVCWLIRAA